MATIDGHAEPAFSGVADAFRANFDERGEVGAAVSVYLDGRPVVDLWGGVADVAIGRPWQADTIVLVYSCTKGVSAVCANLLIERGELDPDAPVAKYWPEFGAAGKDAIPVSFVLSHRAGLPLVDADLTLEECLSWEPVIHAIERQAPIWEPGTKHGYHMRTYGWLVGEIVRRVTGRTLGRFFAEEIAAPLGLDFWIGLPAAQEERVAPVIPPPSSLRELMASLGDDMLLGRVVSAPSGHFHYDEMWNTRQLHECELPSSNGIASAVAVSRMYAALVTPVAAAPVFDDATIARATTPQIEGTDVVIGAPMRYGLGFSLGDALSSAARPSAFGHSGAGGSLGFADPEHGVGFGYVMNRMQVGLAEDRRPRNLVRAMYSVLEDV